MSTICVIIVMKTIRSIFLAVFFIGFNQLFSQDYNILLGRPTNQSITISIQFVSNSDFYFSFGILPNQNHVLTDTFQTNSVFPSEIELNSLQSNQMYFYKLFYKKVGEATFRSSETFHFQTQRAFGETFTFTLEADEHLYDKKGIKSLYDICLKNQASANPDFMMSLGDIFGDDHNPYTITEAEIDNLHEYYRPILGNITHSIPFYVCLGNHEGEMDYYLYQNPGDNMSYYATKYRQLYYPNPYPNEFYGGNTQKEDWGIGYPENYYSWVWGNALFVVLDVYRDQCDTSAKPGGWSWTLGEPQYQWLKSTLENDTSKFKFVFAHHVSGQGRSGINQAKLFEWGGKDSKGQYQFNNKRPGWSKPIHQLFVDNGVNIFFQGHDHVFAHEMLDGVHYQALPMPSDTSYMIGKLANADAYTQDTFAGSGHLNITVSKECVNVSYMSAFLPKDTLKPNQKNNQPVFEYQIGTCINSYVASIQKSINLNLFPNPASNVIRIDGLNDGSQTIQILNLQGKVLKITQENVIDISDLDDGLYIANTEINGNSYQNKFIKITK